MTALNAAASRGPLALVELLIRKGALEWQPDGKGRPPLVAARRGHSVTILERADALGGQVKLAARQPEHGIIANVIDHLEAMARHLGVTVRTGVEATAESLACDKPNHIIIATGSEPNLPRGPEAKSEALALGRQIPLSIPGLDLPFVHSSDDVMSGAVTLSG